MGARHVGAVCRVGMEGKGREGKGRGGKGREVMLCWFVLCAVVSLCFSPHRLKWLAKSWLADALLGSEFWYHSSFNGG